MLTSGSKRKHKKKLELEDKRRQSARIKEYLKYLIIVIAVICLFFLFNKHDFMVSLFLITRSVAPDHCSGTY